MNDQQIKAIIQSAEDQVGSSSFVGAKMMALTSVASTGLVLIDGLSWVVATITGLCCVITVSFWSDGKATKRRLVENRALTVWQELVETSAFSDNPSLKERELLKSIQRIYERDPQGQILPLSQAVRLILAWKKQQNRLRTIEKHVEQMKISRSSLKEKQKLLHQLNDRNENLERALVRIDDDLSPLERSCDALSASCTRLEALVVEVDATVRRRELHREVGEITARLSPGQNLDSFDVATEHLDLERQISREIETYLQLERETNAHLRDL